MKYKIITKTLFVLFIMACTISTSSCSQEEENLFDESAALRLNKSITEATDLLQSSENGWIMEYFPNTASAGFTYLLKFPSSKVATFATINQYVTTYKEADGFWRVINDMGPVLTFDTYNDIFHIFADPAAPGTSDGDGVGLNGDYEFLVINKTADMVTLKGKKHGAITILRKLAAGQQWQDYFKVLDNMNSTIFGSFNTNLSLKIDDNEAYTLYNGNSHIFTIVPKDGNVIDNGTDKPFIITDYGIRLVNPITVGETSVQDFKLSDDKNELIGIGTDLKAKITAMPAYNVFMDIIGSSKYMILKNSDENLGSTVKDAYQKFNNTVTSKTRKLEYIGFVKDKNWGISLVVNTTKSTSKIEGFLSFSISANADNSVNLKFNGFNGKYDTNGKTYYDSYGMSEFVSLIEDNYNLALQGNALSSTTIRFTSKTTPSKWFDLLLK
jgi:hypothetical protein